MRLTNMIMLVMLSVFFVGFVKAELVFREDFEADQLDENVWGVAGAGIGGVNGGIISDKQAYDGTRSWWIVSNNGIYHIVDPPLAKSTVNAWPIGAGSWMYIGICTTGPNYTGYYYRSVKDGEICVGDERETGWHLFAFVIDAGDLEVYVDGEKTEGCDMPELGTLVIFHAWVADQFQKEGGFIDDIYISLM